MASRDLSTPRSDRRGHNPVGGSVDRSGGVAEHLEPSQAPALLELVLSTPTVESYLEHLVAMTEGLGPAIAGCGITLRRSGHVLSAATSNVLAAGVDEVEHAVGSGPCLEALSTGEVVTVEDLLEDGRWPDYRSGAVDHGVRSSIAIPLEVAGTTIGALNCYGTHPDVFLGELRRHLDVFAAQAQTALALVLRNTAQSDIQEQLLTAMQSRSLIDQALGIVMSRQRCTADEAFAMLRSASQSRNRKVTDIAADLIATTSGEPPRPGRFES